MGRAQASWHQGCLRPRGSQRVRQGHLLSPRRGRTGKCGAEGRPRGWPKPGHRGSFIVRGSLLCGAGGVQAWEDTWVRSRPSETWIRRCDRDARRAILVWLLSSSSEAEKLEKGARTPNTGCGASPCLQDSEVGPSAVHRQLPSDQCI